jgi:outer membrane protein OmpA-like peptidoglycan-associated protein
MKIRWNKGEISPLNYKNLYPYMKILKSVVCALVLCAAGSASAQDAAPVDMTIAENLATPAVPNKASNAIIRHMDRIGKTFSKHGLEVKTARKGEVIDVIIPCDDLFNPNEAELKADAHRLLSAFNALLKLPTLYKMLVVVHSDDAGSEAYSVSLTEERSNAIDDYFSESFGDSINLVPYGVGFDEPRASNNSIAGRQSNRRVEFYIIPEKQTVEMAKSGKL